MTRVIYKYPIQPADVLLLDMPQGATLLTVQIQDHQPFLWASVIPGAPVETRRFRLIPTGRDYDDAKLVYLGTFVIAKEGPALVFHLFEETR